MLALAVRASRVGYVFLIDGELKDWHLSQKASLSSTLAKERMTEWLEYFSPDVVVIEDHHTAGRKSRKTRAIIKALLRTARISGVFIATVKREQHYPNKFVEARDLARRFPELTYRLPKRRKLWQREPRNLVYFECLALAIQSGCVEEERGD